MLFIVVVALLHSVNKKKRNGVDSWDLSMSLFDIFLSSFATFSKLLIQ